MEGLPPREHRTYKSYWVEMLTAREYQYFWTATHEEERTVRQWIRILGRMKRRLNDYGLTVEFFYVAEENQRGGHHVHVLVKFPGMVEQRFLYNTLRKVGDEIGGGMNKTETIYEDNREKTLRYIVKYMFKDFYRATVEDRYGFG